MKSHYCKVMYSNWGDMEIYFRDCLEAITKLMVGLMTPWILAASRFLSFCFPFLIACTFSSIVRRILIQKSPNQSRQVLLWLVNLPSCWESLCYCQASAVEIEQVCNKAHDCLLETAAIAVQPPGGGPEELVIAVVLKEGTAISSNELKKIFSSTLMCNLNPLFKVCIPSVSFCWKFSFLVGSFPEAISKRDHR